MENTNPLRTQLLTPATPEEWQQYYQLRYDVLRAPWQQARGSEKAEDDAAATHAMLVDDAGEVLGVCRLHLATPTEGQIRFMAVRPDQQGRGLGRTLLQHLEAEARRQGAQVMTLQARENALPFYKSSGYSIKEKTYLLFGEVQHYRMEKAL
jgi:N-acetylglutamate synthase-like GNAT family acetyltransferase